MVSEVGDLEGRRPWIWELPADASIDDPRLRAIASSHGREEGQQESYEEAELGAWENPGPGKNRQRFHPGRGLASGSLWCRTVGEARQSTKRSPLRLIDCGGPVNPATGASRRLTPSTSFAPDPK